MSNDRSPPRRARTVLAAFALAAGGFVAVLSGPVQAAPLTLAPAEALAPEAGTSTVQYGYGWGHRHHGGWGRHHHRHWGGHRHWGHRHHGWGHRHWGHRHHGWGHHRRGYW